MSDAPFLEDFPIPSTVIDSATPHLQALEFPLPGFLDTRYARDPLALRPHHDPRESNPPGLSSTREPSPADAPYFGTILHLVNATESFARLRVDLERQCAKLQCWHAALEMPAMPVQPPQMGVTEDDVSAYLRRTLLERAAWFVQGISGLLTVVGSPFPPMLVTPSDIGISTFDDPFLATEIAAKTSRSLPRRILFLLSIW
ncbi:uncharacterized protein JCM10292_002161 [Rhodotorula paludigena]|uniref:uncharacterized protein n=1 Tax=Rhodotorula paludigena TaxID=86838 RepID=UPI0031784436